MFTGIVQELSEVISFEKGRLTLRFSKELLTGLKKGASVSIDGVCLTVVEIKKNQVSFECIEETLTLTTLFLLRKGDRVNCERSLKYGDEVGGHFVTGHVMGRALLKEKEKNIFTLETPLAKKLLPKGYVALDGTSLTVVDVDPQKEIFTVHLIPETLRMTTFGFKKKGSFFNVEIDLTTQETAVATKTSKKSENAIVSRLSHFLADSFVVYVKTLNFHWNMVGSGFFMYHKLLEEQYKELADAADELAERVRMLGSHAPASLKEFLALSQIKESSGKLSQEKMVAELVKDHETLVKSASELIKLTEQANDQGTGDLMIERLRASDKYAWLLRSHLQK